MREEKRCLEDSRNMEVLPYPKNKHWGHTNERRERSTYSLKGPSTVMKTVFVLEGQ